MNDSDTEKSEKSHVMPALVAAVITILLWSGTPIANKIAVGYMDGLTAGVFRSMLAGFVALAIATIARLPIPESRSDRLLLATSGISCFGIWPMFMSVGLANTTAGHGGLIMAMIPVFTVLGASLTEGRRPRAGWWVGAAIALGGTAILVVSRGVSLEMAEDGASIVGDLIILVGCLFCAIGYVAGGKLSPKIGSFATTFWGLAIALVVLVPTFAMIASDTEWGELPTTAWLAIGWMTFLSSLLGYVLWFFALGRGGIGRIGSLHLAAPVLTLIASSIVLGEAITALIGVVCVAIVAGTYWAQRSVM